jgi:H+/gluconate symporter-like permease
VGLLGILLALGVLMWLSFRGWSVLLLAPAAALLVAAFSAEPLLAHWTHTFMGSGAGFVAQFFPLFLLGAVFGKLMEDSGSVGSIARFMSEKLGAERAVLAVVLAGALVTYGGVSLFVAFFVLAPMAQALFRAGNVPRRLMPAAIALGTTTFTMTAMPGTPAIQNAIPMPFFGTTPFAAPGIGLIASAIMLLFGLAWLRFAQGQARGAGEGFTLAASGAASTVPVTEDALIRERATTAAAFDPPEAARGRPSPEEPAVVVALAPFAVMIGVNLLMSFMVLPRMTFSALQGEQWRALSIASASGLWSVLVALACAIAVLLVLNRKRLMSVRESMDAGANASVLPVLSVASLVGFGAVVAAMPAFGEVRDWILGIDGGLLVSLSVSVNVLAALTGSASGGMTIALDALGGTYLALAQQQGINPDLLHRIAAIGAGTLDSLPHNGAVVTLLAVCGATHRESYLHIAMTAIVGPIVALVAVIVLASAFGSF